MSNWPVVKISAHVHICGFKLERGGGGEKDGGGDRANFSVGCCYLCVCVCKGFVCLLIYYFIMCFY